MQATPKSTLTFGIYIHEDFTAILPPPLIQEETLSVNGEIMYTKYWFTASGRLAQEQCGHDN